MAKITYIHRVRIFNFESEVEEIKFSNDLKIIKKIPIGDELKNIYPIRHELWPNFIIENKHEVNFKGHKIKIKNEEFVEDNVAVVNNDFINATIINFVNVLFLFRLLRSSSFFFDDEIKVEILKDGDKYYDSSIQILQVGIPEGKEFNVKKDEVGELRKNYNEAMNLSDDERFRTGITRLSYGMERANRRDKIIDFFTGLESLYIGKNSSELTFKLSTKIGSIFGKTIEDKLDIYKYIKDFYALRGCLVHGGKYKKSKKEYFKNKEISKLENYLRESLKLYLKNAKNFEDDNLVRVLFGKKILDN